MEEYLTSWLQEHRQYALLLVPILAFLEAFIGVGIFVSGAILLSVCVILYIEQIATLSQMLPLAFCGAVLSDHSGYYIGRWLGPQFHNTRFAQKRAGTLKEAEERIRKYGKFAIVFGRLITSVRSVVPALIGISGMPRLRYTLYDLLACTIWTIGLGLLIVGIDKVWN
jgi:membrane-associated protein